MYFMGLSVSRSGVEWDGIVTGLHGGGFHESPVVPRIAIGRARALYVGPGLALAPHLNVATTIAVSLGEPLGLRIWCRAGGWSPWRSLEVGVIPSETLHHLRSCGPMAFLYLDPLTDRRQPRADADLQRGREVLLRTANRTGIDAAFAAFGLREQAPRDPRIARVALEIERRPEAFARLGEAAALACLSPSRFRARFDADVGLPFRRYRLWRRMAAVMRTLACAGNLTDAAHAAGFSSSAHLSTAFRRMFGLSPSEFLALGLVIDVSGDPAAAQPPTPTPASRRPPSPPRASA
jgi:AraC-like DNA-binding protein